MEDNKSTYLMDREIYEYEEMIVNLVKMWMLKNWGKRCKEYEKDCPLCKAWKYFDYLFGSDWD